MMYRPDNRAEQVRGRIDEIKEEVDLEDTRWGQDAVERITELSKKGKIVRGGLFLDAVDSMGGRPSECLDCAAAIEITHTALLIHDDIFDGDEKRRGENAIHVQYGNRFEDVSMGVAEDLAVCAGDMAFFIAFELLSGSEADSELLKVFSRTFARVGAGQMTDIESSARGELMEEDELLDFYADKTASYTFSLPLRAASIEARGRDSPSLDRLGKQLGVLYQIKDDQLDFVSSEKSGKPALSDLREGKNTIFISKLASRKDREDIEEILTEGLQREEAESLYREMKRIGVMEEVNDLMDRKHGEIDQRIAEEIEQEALRELLKDVTELVVRRNR